jgi:dipeptidyl aminopeptidase/acylaminoacyl peptidase
MLDLVKTVLPGVNKAIEMGVADPARLGIMGHSHGGYNTLSLIADTKRFKAAIVVDGLGDLVSGYGEMDRAGAAFGISVAEQGQEKMGGTPWQFRDRYIENSPFFYLDRVDTPVLIVQGVEDTVVPPFLSDEVFVALRRLGKEVDYAKYDGEGHSPAYWSYVNQLDFCNRVIAWMDTHLKEPNPNASKR